ncbi:hypothetical protein CO615_04590 [Lysobacteraceae bacterium NML75-0749]|nr:hypothetical protein CO615_04590 [Xanthomonadaceae bacterium NML75-0749]
MTSRADRYNELMQKITTAIVLKTGTGEVIAQHYAQAMMEFLQEQRADNGNLYIPLPSMRCDIAAIRAALEAGESVRSICRRYGISRAKLFRLFPGGLPRAKRGRAA